MSTIKYSITPLNTVSNCYKPLNRNTV